MKYDDLYIMYIFNFGLMHTKKSTLKFPRFLMMYALDNILFRGNYVIILRVIRGILCD